MLDGQAQQRARVLVSPFDVARFHVQGDAGLQNVTPQRVWRVLAEAGLRGLEPAQRLRRGGFGQFRDRREFRACGAPLCRRGRGRRQTGTKQGGSEGEGGAGGKRHGGIRRGWEGGASMGVATVSPRSLHYLRKYKLMQSNVFKQEDEAT
ncbi:hypothetical protein G4G31_12920 [Massilia sp. Se16.2.3]|nr:hypothetical protein G4G31_12920 [Massilia sp. Se16.2.3]